MTKGTKRPKWTGRDFKRARSSAEAPYYYRMNRLGQPEGQLFQDYRGPIPPRDIQAAEIQLANTPCFWQCVSITYFEDPWGKQYRRWGFAKTEEQLKITKQPLDPVLMAAQQYAEEDANMKQAVARSFILAPWSKKFPDLFPLIKKHAKELGLTNEDLDGIKGYLDDDFEIYEYDPTKLESPATAYNLDAQIASYL